MQTLPALLVTRAILGVATGGITAASLGLMGKIYQADERSQVLAYISSTISLASIIYPLLGGWVGSFNWQWAFYLYAIALPLAVLVLIVFRKTQASKKQGLVIEYSLEDLSHTSADTALSPVPKKLLALLCQPEILRLLIAIGVTSGIVYAAVVYIPLYLRSTLAASTVFIGIVLASKAMGSALISAFGVRFIAKRLGNMGVIVLGYGIIGFALSLLPHLHQATFVLFTAILFGMGFGIVVPSLYGLLANEAPTSLQSSVLAAGTGAAFLGQFLTPVLLAPILTHAGVAGIFYTSATIALIIGSSIMIWLGRRRYCPSS